MAARDADELALDDKLDVARTMLALNHRIVLRHEKERVLSAIKQSHHSEVEHGEVSTAAVPTADEILGLYASDASAIGQGGASGDAATGSGSSSSHS